MSVNLEKKGRRIEVRADEPIAGLKTTIPGAYQTVAGHWTVPLSYETCCLLRQRFGRRLKMGSELRRWATGVVRSRKYMSTLAASDDAALTILPTAAPALYAAMNARTYQRVGARFVADNTATLVADDPGLGKTLIALAGILEAQVPGPYLIVAPKTAADSVWRREILRWLPPGHRPVILPQFRYQRERKLQSIRYGPKTWLIVHPETAMTKEYLKCHECGKLMPAGYRQARQLECGHMKARKTQHIIQHSYPQIFDVEWGAIVIDESHESLIRRSGKPTQRRRGLELLPLRSDGLRIAMSGTPFDSKPHQLWGTLNWLDPVTYSAFHRWAELYWQKGGYTGFEIGEFRKDRETLLWDSLSAVALRRTKAEVAQDLPAKMEVGTPLIPGDENSPVGIWLPMDGKQEAAYREMELLSIANLDSGRLEAVSALAELTRLKQLASSYGEIKLVTKRKRCAEMHATDSCPYLLHNNRYGCPDCRKHGYHIVTEHKYFPALPSNKFDWIVSSLEEWGYPRNPLTKVVIVSFYTGILEVFQQGIERHFRTKHNRPLCTAITGKTPSQDRRKIIDRFNRPGHEQIMLLNVKAGGTAITIDSADRMIFVSETRIPDQQKQAEDRIHRVSNPRQCMYYYLRSMGTVDVGTALVNQEMIQDSHRLLDARRGVDYVRHVIASTSG